MDVQTRPGVRTRLADKQALVKILEEQDARLGLKHDPNATAAESRRRILADGVRPEDNIGSRGIIDAREE
jgi:hypothetical protein